MIYAECPKCHALAGQPCTANGKKTKYHKAREALQLKVVDARQVQVNIENRLGYKSLMLRVQEDMLKAFPEEMEQANTLIQEYLHAEHWEGKTQRLKALQGVDLTDKISSLICSVIATTQKSPMKLVTLASMVCGQLSELDNKSDKLQTAAEMIAVLEPLGLWESFRSVEKTVFIASLVDLSEELIDDLEGRFYLPPMIVKPNKLESNKDSGYLTQSDSLILGDSYNYHEGNISLDVLNTLNGIEYSLDEEFLQLFQEEWTKEEISLEEFKELSKAEKDIYRMDQETWSIYRKQCDAIYAHLAGKKFHFTHKVDKRGRVYSQGYHVNPQGKAYKKAMLNLAHKETCTGLEDWM